MIERTEITRSELSTLLELKENSGLDLLMRPRPLSEAKDDLERAFVMAQLERNDWDISETAVVLGLARTNLHRKIKQLGIERKG